MDKREQYIDKQIIEQIMELRKQLHRIPEHSMQEVKTKQLLMDFLKSHTALEIVDCGAWFYAVKRAVNPVTTESNKAFDVSETTMEIPDQMAEYRQPIAFRADMDAVCGKDGKPGHFCGHDGTWLVSGQQKRAVGTGCISDLPAGRGDWKGGRALQKPDQRKAYRRNLWLS